MGRLLVDLLPITILSALTPWTIVGVIVLLASKGGVKNAVAFYARLDHRDPRADGA